MGISKEVAEQIETAYDYRGHVTLTLNDGTVIEGFLFNREVTPLKGEPYVEILRKDSDERLRFASQPFVAPKKD
jgi:hypothetical protein